MSKLPDTLILGMVRGEWPVQAFTADAHALHWLAEDPSKRYLWRADVTNVRPLRYVPPSEPALTEDPAVTE